jgi:hypothetical protein
VRVRSPREPLRAKSPPAMVHLDLPDEFRGEPGAELDRVN